MGGPCKLKTAEEGTKTGPAATDNFQIKPFEYEGQTFYSCEHAYQAAKCPAASEGRLAIQKIVPHKDEDSFSHGMRCWRVGQSVTGVRADWDSAKLATMLDVNRIKYATHADCRDELLATGDVEICGCSSTGWTFKNLPESWTFWNGKIQMLIREELRPTPSAEQAQRRLELQALFDDFYREDRKSPVVKPSPAPKPAAEDPRFSALALRLEGLKTHGLEFPWTCPLCTTVNANYPQRCEACDEANASYAAATQALLEAERPLSERPLPALSSAQPLTALLVISKLACDALQPLVARIHAKLGDRGGAGAALRKRKSDGSAYTLADGLVQHFLGLLFGGEGEGGEGGKFAGLVGEERGGDAALSARPYRVGGLEVPEDLLEAVDAAALEMASLTALIPPLEAYKKLSVFIDPIDGTREFASGGEQGDQSTMLIGFADESGKAVAGLVYRPVSSPPTWAAGAASEGTAAHRLHRHAEPSTTGLLVSNSGLPSPFVTALYRGGGGHSMLSLVQTGGAGNKVLHLLEGRAAAYVLDRAYLARWDIAAAEAVLCAHNGAAYTLASFLATSSSSSSSSSSPSPLQVPVGYSYFAPTAGSGGGQGCVSVMCVEGFVALAPSAAAGEWRARCLEAAERAAPVF